ncbi:MAG: Do family serine endopeptidase [Alphaproteobacteria bacterium]|nr:Do family serine endopeptidase [Alphaproteobacteria bacterium]
MTKLLLTTFLLCFLVTPAFAEDKETTVIPQSKSQVHLSFAPVVKQITPSVINIFTKRVVTRTVSPFMNDPLFSQFFQGMGFSQQRLEGSLGSGVIVDTEGLAVTNAHVIRGADEITISLSDGREFPAKIVLQDEASDLALLKINTQGEKLPAARLETSEKLEVGDLVIAIGNPFGVGQTVTSGIISALARSSMNINNYNFFIQTDAAINPGNSGGPLVSMSGGVIGINSAIYSKDGGSLGIGFAIPSEMVQTILSAEKNGQISRSGELVRPWVGLTAQDVTPDIAASLGLKTPTGALVSDLHNASPALAAGLRKGDVITAINGHHLRDASEMKFRLATLGLGEKAQLTYKRAGDTFDTTLQSIAPPDSPPRDERKISGRNPLNGARVANINPAVEVELGLKNMPSKGVVITSITPRTAASQIVNLGDIILSINGRRISDPKQVEEEMAHPGREGWILKILSSGQERTLIVR